MLPLNLVGVIIKHLKNKYIIFVFIFVLGFFLGKHNMPEKIDLKEEVRKKDVLISGLQSRIESLKKESLKENVKTIIVERPDGTRVTTKTRVTERESTHAKLAKKEKAVMRSAELISNKRITKTFSSNMNAIGIRPYYLLFREFEAEAYIKAGTKCFVFDCYAQGSFLVVGKEPALSVGIEYRF